MNAGLLGYWVTGLLGYWVTGLLGYWKDKQSLPKYKTNLYDYTPTLLIVPMLPQDIKQSPKLVIPAQAGIPPSPQISLPATKQHQHHNCLLNPKTQSRFQITEGIPAAAGMTNLQTSMVLLLTPRIPTPIIPLQKGIQPSTQIPLPTTKHNQQNNCLLNPKVQPTFKIAEWIPAAAGMTNVLTGLVNL